MLMLMFMLVLMLMLMSQCKPSLNGYFNNLLWHHGSFRLSVAPELLGQRAVVRGCRFVFKTTRYRFNLFKLNFQNPLINKPMAQACLESAFHGQKIHFMLSKFGFQWKKKSYLRLAALVVGIKLSLSESLYRFKAIFDSYLSRLFTTTHFYRLFSV